ncbi:hypothetical protein GYMLUDRAFT_470984 [Collybiopsis luxurians FD-317 M1]|uniref:Unplaced genomic scaffold GYMLUscaffold_17, whole genome shotgun sequence n=1 Tax=Collybiopsis luxurians FD-317 M1 TaxID=944289 RepID=A0A0D0CJF9_9AGAR|nr:hypothetical protein GYMLUDRAFT_470984 [Collybiopsis luxurians FD-317 M1]
MLANKPSDNISAPTPDTNMSVTNERVEMAAPVAPQIEDQAAALQAVVDNILASPEFTMANDFLSSPFISTPYDDFSTSPMDDSPFVTDLSTPIMDAIDDEFGWMSGSNNEPLFNDAASALYNVLEEPVKQAAPVTTAAEILNNKDLFTMSPATPMLDSAHSLYPSPRLPSVNVSAPASSSAPRKVSASLSSAVATGTRRNITPDSLVPLDAPTQVRRYLTPSSTSRKEVPTSFAKKRSRTVAFGDNDDEDAEEASVDAPGPHATELEQIEYKRRLSTIAARKSRRRKLEYKLMLETRVDELEKEAEKWRTRCKVLQEVLRSKSVDFRFDDEE